MAFEADCGVSTVLEALRVVSIARHLTTKPSAPLARRLGTPSGKVQVGVRNSKLKTQNYPRGGGWN
jgi:hypothetical protein